MKVGIVVGSIREGRKGIHVGQWVLDEASKREDATFELIDVKSPSVRGLCGKPVSFILSAVPSRITYIVCTWLP